jgi:hypothetical protein
MTLKAIADATGYSVSQVQRACAPPKETLVREKPADFNVGTLLPPDPPAPDVADIATGKPPMLQAVEWWVAHQVSDEQLLGLLTILAS